MIRHLRVQNQSRYCWKLICGYQSLVLGSFNQVSIQFKMTKRHEKRNVSGTFSNFGIEAMNKSTLDAIATLKLSILFLCTKFIVIEGEGVPSEKKKFSKSYITWSIGDFYYYGCVLKPQFSVVQHLTPIWHDLVHSFWLFLMIYWVLICKSVNPFSTVTKVRWISAIIVLVSFISWNRQLKQVWLHSRWRLMVCTKTFICIGKHRIEGDVQWNSRA